MRPRHSRSGLNLLPSASCNFSFYFSVVVGAPYRLAGLTPRGADLLASSLDRVPLAPQYPFERPAGELLQVPERLKENCKFGGFA